MEKYQNPSGMTLRPARSDAIHCTRKRMVNRPWARKPSNTHQSSLATKTSCKYAPTARDRSTSKGPLLRFRNAFFAANEPPYASKVENADPKPVEEAVIRRAVPARPIDDVDIADVKAFAPDQRRQKAMQPVEIRQLKDQVAPKSLQPASGVARTVFQNRAAHAVGDARLQSLEARTFAPHALSGDQAGPRRARFQRG